MTSSVEQNVSRTDPLKWAIVLALLAGAVIGNQYFAELAAWMRVLAIVVMVVLALLVAYTTNKGREIFDFGKESRTEIRKVVWPTRQETVQTTLIVAAFTVVIALFMWFVDWVLIKLVGLVIA
ncbi:preprotein translocase subunit SecE [Permianibacter aggregans]|uniref:Protein translocase subunit SecE n=1 Tax=Permianibacter aggregans TaxID=1510150 RepID=A0A4V3D643_9GAMM|nr:preprotein translocase subunit SecE [Permianibacter aggregans]QGX39196.1 preprotein translocase subunit SecE [Permianibacter aggregans]TDQ42567.1 protein translocase subunit secE/sec61 gamma [Permianibacter aggregans]